MMSNGPSRTFTREAVEAWLHRLSSCDWEKSFNRQQLKDAQSAYRKGILSAIDIQSDQAIVTKRVSREETYSVIEWSDRGPEIRTSLDDEVLGQVLATAGLYEIEELISEIQEEDPLFGEQNIFSTSVEKNEPNKSASNSVFEEKSTESATLLIQVEIVGNKGMSLTPKWRFKKGREFLVYGQNKPEEEIDRPSLMHFVAEAGVQGFTFDKSKNCFLLYDWKKISAFCEHVLHSWEESFELEFIGEARLLKHGQRTLTWVIEARSLDESSMILRDNFQIGSFKLGRSHSRMISKAHNGATFIRGHGLVQLDKEQLDDFDWWKKNRGDKSRGHWPRYMLFSLFARKYLKARPDGRLANWESSIRKLQTNGIAEEFSFLRPYQKNGVAHLHALHTLGCHGLLADEMGLGKTIQALCLITSNKENDFPNLVICPASVVPVWVRESKDRFPKLKVEILHKENLFSDHDGSCLWIASYTQIRRHRHLLNEQEFKYAVLDEAQLIKNPKAKVTQACLSIRSRHRLALSGTPIENSALDLWTIFRFLMPGLLGGRKEFEKEMIGDPSKSGMLLRKQVFPFVLRRLKSEVATELPPKLETELTCPLNEEQKKVYRKLTEGAISTHHEHLKSAFHSEPTHIFSLLTRLRQVCCDLGLLPGREHSTFCGAKGDILIEKLLDLSSSGAKVIVFSQFTSFLEILRKRIRLALPELRILELSGSTRNRSVPVDNFENNSGPIVLLASLKAAGLGVTLKSADYVFLMDPWWNPAVEEQAIDRAHRLGRVNPTFIYRLVAKGTIEERVRQLKIKKKETFHSIIGQMNGFNSLSDQFSTLRELIELRD